MIRHSFLKKPKHLWSFIIWKHFFFTCNIFGNLVGGGICPFFSLSLHQWKMLQRCSHKCRYSREKCSQTRWGAHYWAVWALKKFWKANFILWSSVWSKRKYECRRIGSDLLSPTCNFSFPSYLVFRCEILEVDYTQKYLQAARNQLQTI